MGGDGVCSVAVVLLELDPKALAARDLVSLHPPKQLCRLPCEHGTNDKLNVAFELGKGLVLWSMRGRLIGRLLIGWGTGWAVLVHDCLIYYFETRA